MVSQLAEILKVNRADIPERVRSLTQRIKEMEKNLQTLRGQQLQAEAARLVESAQDINGVRVLTHDAGTGVNGGDVRTLVTDLRARLGDGAPAVIAVTGESDGKVALVVATNPSARDLGISAGALLKDAAQAMGGRGGGKPDMAQGGGGEPAKAPHALESIASALRSRA